jgi:hypothetical protein
VLGQEFRVSPLSYLVDLKFRTYLLEEGEAKSDGLPTYGRMLIIGDLKHDEI